MRKIFLIIASVVVLTSCSSNDNEPSPDLNIYESTSDNYNYLVQCNDIGWTNNVSSHERHEIISIDGSDITYEFRSSSGNFQEYKNFYFISNRESITVTVRKIDTYTIVGQSGEYTDDDTKTVTLSQGDTYVTSGGLNGGYIVE